MEVLRAIITSHGAKVKDIMTHNILPSRNYNAA